MLVHGRRRGSTRASRCSPSRAPTPTRRCRRHLQADAAVTQARATLLKAQADVERTKDLFDHNAVAKKEVLNADSALAQAQAALDQALASREQAERRLSVLGLTPRDFKQQVTVRSPLSGQSARAERRAR